MGNSASVSYIYVGPEIIKSQTHCQMAVSEQSCGHRRQPSDETDFSRLVIHVPTGLDLRLSEQTKKPESIKINQPFHPRYKNERVYNFYQKFMLRRIAGLSTTAADLED